MNRSTIDYGIDLGTTNSAIAVFNGANSEIIKNNSDRDITSSAVYIDKKDMIQTGDRAKNTLYSRLDDTYIEFKRRMGTEFVYNFKSSGRKMKPEELSAEVLKMLKADVQRRRNEEINSAVITVPAAFEIHQCDATKKAASLAGFINSPLLQEPVAAALAYGFQRSSGKEYWLVYDFGGGTFDAALLKTEDGIIDVVNHGGDNFLGGSDIDWAILEKIIIPRFIAENNLSATQFTRANAGENGQWRQMFAKMKHFAEQVKIDLSISDSQTFSVDNLVSSDKSVEIDSFECEINKNELIKVAEPFILRSIEICKKVLKDKGISSKDLAKVILVGGPTLAPYFREIIESELGVNPDFSVDPLTVVAKGAAIFASTQKVEIKRNTVVNAGACFVDLKYKPVGVEEDPVVGGIVSLDDKGSLAGYTVEIVNQKSQWRSGKITLKSEGKFLLNLRADKGDRNVFLIELMNPFGAKTEIKPDRFTYTVSGAVIEEQPMIHSIGVSLANNSYDILLPKGVGLPYKKKSESIYKTVKAIKAGQDTEALSIPIVEGDNPLADRNRLIYKAVIDGSKIRRDLPIGSEVEVTFKIDESRIITIFIYVPCLDEEYEYKIEPRKKNIELNWLEEEFEDALSRIKRMKEQALAAEDNKTLDIIDKIKSSALMSEIRETLNGAKGDPDSAEKCQKRILELKINLDEIENNLEWPALVVEVKDWLAKLKGLVVDCGKDADNEKLQRITQQVDDVISSRDVQALKKRFETIQHLFFSILANQPWFWVGYLENLIKEREQMTDQRRAGELINQGRKCIDENNVDGLRNVVRQLSDMLPRNIAEEIQKRGYDSGIMRG